jgi:uncharacterized protein DUF1883
MQYIHNDLGFLNGGDVVEVTLSSQANVKLMDGSNFANYRQGGQHRFFGGHAKQSPIRLQVPSAGHWHVAVDLGGYSGNVRTGVRVLR